MKNNFYSKKTLCNVYTKPTSKSEVSSQILYGEKFSIISKNKKWIKIKTDYDNYTGYIKYDKFTKNFKPTHKIFKLKAQILKKLNNKSILTKLINTKKVRTKIIKLKQDINKPDFGRN